MADISKIKLPDGVTYNLRDTSKTDEKVKRTSFYGFDTGTRYLLTTKNGESSSTSTDTVNKAMHLYCEDGNLVINDEDGDGIGLFVRAPSFYGEEIETSVKAGYIQTYDIILNAAPGKDKPVIMFMDSSSKKIFLPHAYSTDEQVVGYWIDGSPIYEKTVELGSVTTIASNGNTTISTSKWQQAGKPIDFKAYRMTQAGYQVGICTIAVIATDGKLTIYNTRAGSLAFDTFTIQYIKT